MRRRDWKTEGRNKVKTASQGDLWKPVEGMNYFRVLPNKRGLERAPYIDWGLHRDVGPENTLSRCGIGTDANSCWLCDHLQSLVARDPSKRAVAESMARSDQIVVQILPIDVETQQPGTPRAWWLREGGKRSMGIRLISLLASSGRDYDDPRSGYNVSLERTGTGPRNTEYGPFEPDQEPTQIPGSVRGQMKALEDLIPAYNAADQEAAFYGRKRTPGESAESGRAEDAGDDWGDSKPEPQSAPLPEGDDWGDTGETTQVSDAGGDDWPESEPGKPEPQSAPATETDDWGDSWADPEPEPSAPAKPPVERTAKPPGKPAAKRTAKPKSKPPVKRAAKPAPAAKHVAKRRGAKKGR